MKLVVDANVLLAALLKDASTREILLSDKMELFAPEQLSRELRRLLANPKIRKRLKLADSDLFRLSSTIFSRITFVPEETFSRFIALSLKLVTHPEDSPYIALALALKIPLWSNDAALREQAVAKVLTTSAVISILTAGR